MNDTTLYSIVGDEFIESYSVNCIVYHRALSFCKFDYDLKEMVNPTNFKALDEAKNQFPLIMHKGNLIKDDVHAATLFRKMAGPDFFLPNPEGNAMAFLIPDWSKSSLGLINRYLMTCVDTNWQAFQSHVTERIGSDDILDYMDRFKKVNVRIFKESGLSKYTYQDIMVQLQKYLSFLDNMLETNEFLTGDKLNSSDLFVFAQIHRLFHPLVKETTNLKKSYKHLNNWLIKVDEVTKNKYTRPINL